MDGPLSPEHIKATRDAFQGYLYKSEQKAAAAAAAIGVAESTLSQWANGVYKGDNDKITRQINAWIADDARKRDVRVELPYVPTQIAEDFKTVATVARDDGCMAVIIAPSGTGKTMVMRVLAENASGLYLTCHTHMTPRRFLQSLCDLAKVRTDARTTADLVEALCAKLSGSGRSIFLDEAHQLRGELFSLIRTIYDMTGCPIIMAGTDQILPHIDDRANHRGQFNSRCIKYDLMQHVFNAERPDDTLKLGRPLFTVDEIRQLFAHFNLKLTDDVIDFVWALACLPDYGALRLVKRVLTFAQRKWPGKAVTRKQLASIVMICNGDEGRHIATLAHSHIKQMAKTA
jgi:DNA transposition AAA+ family ATPase